MTIKEAPPLQGGSKSEGYLPPVFRPGLITERTFGAGESITVADSPLLALCTLYLYNNAK